MKDPLLGIKIIDKDSPECQAIVWNLKTNSQEISYDVSRQSEFIFSSEGKAIIADKLDG